MPSQMGGYCAHAFICHMALHGPNFFTNLEYQIETPFNFGVSFEEPSKGFEKSSCKNSEDDYRTLFNYTRRCYFHSSLPFWIPPQPHPKIAKTQTSRVESPRTWRELGFRGLGDQGTWNFWNFLNDSCLVWRWSLIVFFCLKQWNTKWGFTLNLFRDVKEWRM